MRYFQSSYTVCLLGGSSGTVGPNSSNAGVSSCQDRHNIGPKLIMLRLYIALMRGNVEKCREIARYHCNFVHVSRKISQNTTQDSPTVPVITPVPSTTRSVKVAAAGGGGVGKV